MHDMNFNSILFATSSLLQEYFVIVYNESENMRIRSSPVI